MAEIRRYDDIMQQALADMIANQDKLTDFNEGSIIHTFLDTVARIAERIYVAIRQGYNDNLRLVPCLLFKFTRKMGNPATGMVEFQRANPIPTRTSIPKATRVSGNGKSYLTTALGFIEPSVLYSNPIPVIAEKAGRDHNVPAYTINTIDPVLPTDVVAVVNHDLITGGTNMESDNEFDERFKIYLNGLSGTNSYGIMNAVLSLPTVRSVSLKNHKPPLQNIYNMSVYIDDGSGNATDETIEAARLAIEGDGTSVHQGHLAPGVNIRVIPPLTVPIIFSSVTVYVYRADPSMAELEIKNVIAEYVNSLTIGKSVVISEVIARIKKLSYVYDVKISQDNIDIQSDQIPRYSNANLNIREIGDAA